jgi:hypothetical protein
VNILINQATKDAKPKDSKAPVEQEQPSESKAEKESEVPSDPTDAAGIRKRK